jgi:nucleoside-diphosphate-sugar epimerase
MTSHAFVTGATGLIGRWLVPALTRRGYVVTAMVRGAAKRQQEYLSWITAHDGIAAQVRLVDGDLGADDLGLDDAARALVRESDVVFHLGGLMAAGLDPERTRAINEGGTERMVELTASLPRRPRLVMISGFRIGASKKLDPNRVGAYEASKLRSNARARELAHERQLALTVVSPTAVIGDSRTGETTQLFGFAEIVRDLNGGKLPAVPGGKRHWLPLVTVDYLAEFLARVTPSDRDMLVDYFLLDDRTPDFGAMLKLVANRLGVKAPRVRLPIPLVRLFLRATGQADKVEGLEFISTDRYDTSSATRAAEAAGLAMPDIAQAIANNVDFLVANGFNPSSVAA